MAVVLRPDEGVSDQAPCIMHHDTVVLLHIVLMQSYACRTQISLSSLARGIGWAAH